MWTRHYNLCSTYVTPLLTTMTRVSSTLAVNSGVTWSGHRLPSNQQTKWFRLYSSTFIYVLANPSTPCGSPTLKRNTETEVRSMRYSNSAPLLQFPTPPTHECHSIQTECQLDNAGGRLEHAFLWELHILYVCRHKVRDTQTPSPGIKSKPLPNY